jgi:hypothetical protein
VSGSALVRNTALLRALLRWNALAYAVVGTVLLGANILVGGGVWSFWPLFAWGMLLALHFFFVKSMDVDERWVEERADELHYRSYDQGHIDDIEHRVEERDASVRPADERE